LAPAWIMVGRVAEDPEGAPPEVPTAMVVADRPSGYWSVPQYLEHDPTGGWLRRPLDVADTALRCLEHVTRDPSMLAGPLPTGRSMEELLVAACADRDLPAVRGVVRRYLRWLRADAAEGHWRAVWAADEPGQGLICSAAKVLTVLDTVLAADVTGEPHLMDPSWASTVRVPVELVLVRALQRFSYRLLSAGHPHPWPAGLTPDRLAVTLAAAAGVTASPGDLAAATRFAVYMEGPLADLSDVDSATRYAELRERWTADPAVGTVTPRGYREALATIGQLSAALSESRAQIRWLDRTVADRDRQLSTLDGVRRSVTYRIGYLFTGPYHLALRLLRRELRRWR
ncbi:MAG: hypothetical protein WCA46_03565, partial [Actinocatenispora sp.]